VVDENGGSFPGAKEKLARGQNVCTGISKDPERTA
jgi:hypothetical protein